MKLTIDEKVCLKHKLTWEEFIVAYMWSHIDDPTDILNNLLKREVLTSKEGKILLTQHWAEVMDEIICDSSGGITDEERLLSLAQKMRECFPEGKMQGTPYYYRCNNGEVIRKLKKFFVQYGNYTDDQIIDATKRFVASFNGNYKFLPLIKYFISKLKPVQEEDGTTHNVEFSPLADYLENKESGEGETINSDDWLYNMRN